MPELKAFCAIRYKSARLDGDLSTVLAPPYDVLDDTDKRSLLARCARNIVAIDLPHLPPKSAGPEAAYRESADTLNQWLEDGTLARDNVPALYLYHQTFEHVGQKHTRKTFVARVRLEPFHSGSILPHEKTFGGPKEDRLALMKATKCQLSPLFGLYSDPQAIVKQTLAPTADGKPDAIGTVDGVTSRAWVVNDSAVIDKVCTAMADRRIYIADGHHRYETALMYRDFVTEENGSTLPEEHPANYVMFVLADMNDPGCLILPYNRVALGIDTETLLEAWNDGVVTAATTAQADMVLFDGTSERETPVQFSNRAMLKTLEPNEVAAWYELDYAYLHRYLIDELLAQYLRTNPTPSGGPTMATPNIQYVKSVEDAKRVAKESKGVALLTKATPMRHLRAVSEAGGLMPQKSTYFYPKLATGITMYPLA